MALKKLGPMCGCETSRLPCVLLLWDSRLPANFTPSSPNYNRKDIQTVYAGKAFLNIDGVQLELEHLLGGFVLLRGFQAPPNKYEFSAILSSLDQNHNAIQN